MIATLALFLWAITVYVVVRYRVHVHVQIEARSKSHGHSLASRRASGDNTEPPNITALHQTGAGVPETDNAGTRFELAEALAALGCRKAKARRIAQGVSQQGVTFDEMLRKSIQEAA